MQRLAVVGSRDFAGPRRIRKWLTSYQMMHYPVHVVTGDALSGADFEAVEWAKAVKQPYTVFPAQWYPVAGGDLDRGAGFKRNALIVADAEEMVCFWDTFSHGTAHDIHLWYMKTGHEPLVLNSRLDQIHVSHQSVIDLLGISRRNSLTGTLQPLIVEE